MSNDFGAGFSKKVEVVSQLLKRVLIPLLFYVLKINKPL